MLERLEYQTDLPVSECLARLRRTSAEHPWSIRRIWSPLPEGTVQSTLWGQRFFLSAWPPLYTRNSFAPLFYGSLRQAPGGAVISGRFLLYPVIIGLLVVWFGGALFGMGVGLYVVASEPGEAGTWVARASAPMGATLGLVLFGYFFVRFCIRKARGQREAIEDYLQSVLRARRRVPTVA
jgi:hypothetical protein